MLSVPLTHRPTAQGARPHWVLRDAALAPVVEVVGSRFLRRYGLDGDGASSKAVHWQLRFPRVTRWARVRARVRVRLRSPNPNTYPNPNPHPNLGELRDLVVDPSKLCAYVTFQASST